MGATQEEYYRGVRMVPYDLVKELAIALGVVGVLGLVLAAAFSSPDVPQVTIATWSQSDTLPPSRAAALPIQRYYARLHLRPQAYAESAGYGSSPLELRIALPARSSSVEISDARCGPLTKAVVEARS